ncbi:hypothetical protein C0995_013886 [Termitomyces sp. Mi166|nr:hypothetical protein C0995_013886 [Termitomyces sp. Mi166\
MSGLVNTPDLKIFGTTGGRNYDYTKIYSSDKSGEEASENARVWNVYLDEAENHDVDMIQSFRNVIDGLLVFAALFSGVVTTFVAQTSQALQPDSAQITASLLLETNQLLRAAGNRTSISAVPAAPLHPGSRTYSSIDLWVNGLFFTSLALSLSTALLTVLAKQWIQAYTAVVTGDAKYRAIIRQFRFQGFRKWKLGEIVESLPLLLHGSVAIFLVGLALYVSQLSSPICGIISAITILTFLFYFGTSVIPAFNIACPYRVPFIFSSTRLLFFVFGATKYGFLYLWRTFVQKSHRMPPWPRIRKLRQSLQEAEHHAVYKCGKFKSFEPRPIDHLAHNSLGWVINHSSNHSVKEIVIEGACPLFDEWTLRHQPLTFSKAMISNSEHKNFFFSAVIYSLSRLRDLASPLTTKEKVEKSTYATLVGNLMKIFSAKSLLDISIIDPKDERKRIRIALLHAYREALRRRCPALSRCLLDWVGPNILQSTNGDGEGFLFACASFGDTKDIHDLQARGMDLNHRAALSRNTLHVAAFYDDLGKVNPLFERELALISVKTNPPLPDLALPSCRPDVVAYLLERGPDPSSTALHHAIHLCCIEDLDTCLVLIEVLLGLGCDRRAKDAHGRTPIDIARSKGYDKVVMHLQHYQTTSRRPYHPTDTEQGRSREEQRDRRRLRDCEQG